MPKGIYQRRRRRHVNSTIPLTSSSSETVAFELGYLYADTKARINAIGAKAGGAVAVRQLAQRMGALLLAEASREVVDSAERVSPLRRASTRVNHQRPAAKVHVRAYAHRTLKGERTPRTRREIPCKICGESVLNLNMGNHMRYKHPVGETVHA